MESPADKSSPATPWMTEVFSLASKTTVPLYAMEDHKNRLSAIGTAFFVQCDEMLFLVTAAHVLEIRKQKSVVYYVNENHAQELRGTVYINEDQHGDVGVLLLSKDVRIPLRIRPVDLSWIGPPNTSFAEGLSMAVGYPVTRNKPNYSTGTINPLMFAIMASEIQPSEYEKVGCSVNQHFVVNFDRETGYGIDSEDGSQIDAPDLQGMSGGADHLVSQRVCNPSLRPDQGRGACVAAGSKESTRDWRVMASNQQVPQPHSVRPEERQIPI